MYATPYRPFNANMHTGYVIRATVSVLIRGFKCCEKKRSLKCKITDCLKIYQRDNEKKSEGFGIFLVSTKNDGRLSNEGRNYKSRTFLVLSLNEKRARLFFSPNSHFV